MKKSFDAFLVRKVPYLGSIFGFLGFILLFLVLNIGGFLDGVELLAFHRRSSIIPWAICISSISIILYFFLKYKKKAILTFQQNTFELTLKNEAFTFPFSKVRKVYCNNSETRKGKPNKRFTFSIETKEDKKLLYDYKTP